MPRAVLYLLFTLGGVAALVYELAWMRSFRVVFGSATHSAAAVLAAYFGGMALGNLVGARLARSGRPVLRYGWMELTVALTALLVGPWLALYNHLYPDLYQWTGGQLGLLTLVRLLLAFVALAPPTIAMGATLPLITRAIVSHEDHVARRAALVYALNIVGATFGALLAGFFLPVSLGVQNSVYLAVAINLIIGVVALGLPKRAFVEVSPINEAAPLEPDSASRRRPATILLFAAAVSGFGTLALEVLYIRILSFDSEGSVYSFGMMLVLFLLFLALASMVVARWLDHVDPWRFLAWTQLAAVVAVLLSPLLFTLVPVFTLGPEQRSLLGRMLKFGLGSAVVLGPPVLLVGVVLPVTWKMATRSPSSVGSHVGLLTCVNTLAAVAGSLVVGFIFLPLLGLGGSTLFVASLYALLAVVAFTRAYEGRRRLAGVGVTVLVVVAWFGLGMWQINLHPPGPNEKVLSYRDGAVATVVVTEQPSGQRALKINHNYLLGSSSTALREIRQGRLPLLLHPSPRRVAFVGVATGITASAVHDFPAVERVVAIELIPGVVDAMPYFRRWNRDFDKDPRVELVVADGRNHLLGTSEQFDVIVSDLFVPWHAGTGDLYTVENFEIMKRRLAPGGIFAQWLAGYQLTVEELRTIAASMLEVFPGVTLWRADFHGTQPIFCLVAYRDEVALDVEATRAAIAHLASQKNAPATLLTSPFGVEMLFVGGDAALRAWARGATLNTDDRPVIEFGSPKSFLHHRQRRIGPVLDFVRKFEPRTWAYAESITGEKSLDEAIRAADLMHDATIAGTKSNFEREYRAMQELVAAAGDVPGVAEAILAVASRYRQRQMTERSDELLAALVAYPEPPLAALKALAAARRLEGRDEEAVELLERMVQRVPNRIDFRLPLVELLTTAARFEQAEPHLAYLVERDPDDPYLRLDLARALDRQGKTTEASAQIDEFQKRWDGAQRKEVWAHLRRLGLGSYVDGAPPQG